MVGAEGFELSTSSSQSWRSTRLSYTPEARSLPRVAARRNGSLPRKDTVTHTVAGADTSRLRPPGANFEHAAGHTRRRDWVV